MLNRRRIVALASAAAVIAGAVAFAPHQQEPTKVRLGVYDSRGVAIAWAGSEYANFNEMRQAYEKAKAAGDTAEQKRLENEGQMQQRLLHFQGFGRYPVDQYLTAIDEKLPQLLKDRDLVAIVWTPNAKADNVELVDVTVDLMKLLGMDEAKAKAMAGEASKRKPLEFAELYELDPKE